MGSRRPLLIAVAGLAAALIVVFAATGPRIEAEASGPIRRTGGACLQLERWGLFGWSVVGRAYGVADVRGGVWHPPGDTPAQCDESLPRQTYMVRQPADAPLGKYRICGLDDDESCLEFRRVEFDPGPPGP